jgi:hypothetical protein
MLGACSPGAVANPVVAGDYPDPSVIREPNGWYSASTSVDWFPAFPILYSPDLRHWRQVGSVLSERPRWAAGDFWAPEFQRRGKRVLVYYSALSRGGRRCIAVASSMRVRGPYRDHGPLACSRIGDIDPLPAVDEYGADWLIWKRNGNAYRLPTPIVAAPLAPGGLALNGLPRELFRGDAAWERDLVEAPTLLRRDGLFYLIYSGAGCCGPRCTYETGVVRSASLLGPWEKRPEPLLRANPVFRCPGHASVFPGPDGAPLLAYHAYSRGDAANRHFLISGLGVGADGWPAVEGPGAASGGAPEQRFGFDRSRLGQGWQWPVRRRPAAHLAGGRLHLRGGVLARKARTTSFRAQVSVSERSPGARAGLGVLSSGGVGVAVELRGRRVVARRLGAGGATRVGATAPAAAAEVPLRVTAGRSVRLAAWVRGRWRVVATGQPAPRSGTRIGVVVSGPPGASAAFDDLWIRPR